jgi:hypothetical protein
MKGNFTEPRLTSDQMKRVLAQMKAEGFLEGMVAEAKKRLPTLKRWKQKS